MEREWETIVKVDGCNGVQRLPVPGGWLYRTEQMTRVDTGVAPRLVLTLSWSAPVFVSGGDR